MLFESLRYGLGMGRPTDFHIFLCWDDLEASEVALSFSKTAFLAEGILDGLDWPL